MAGDQLDLPGVGLIEGAVVDDEHATRLLDQGLGLLPEGFGVGLQAGNLLIVVASSPAARATALPLPRLARISRNWSLIVVRFMVGVLCGRVRRGA